MFYFFVVIIFRDNLFVCYCLDFVVILKYRLFYEGVLNEFLYYLLSKYYCVRFICGYFDEIY